MLCNRESCSPNAGRCPLALVAAVLFLAALLSACGPAGAPADTTVDATSPAAGSATAVPERMTAAEFVAAVRPEDVVVDVRTPAEIADGHLAGAVLADVSAPGFESRVAGLDRETTTYVYCRTGNRSARAADIMRSMGFTRVVNVGGFADLRAAGAPVEVPGE